jgi:anthranilate synthase component 2
LGHQAIGEAFGGKLVNLDTVYHGVATMIEIGKKNEGQTERELNLPDLLSGLPEKIEVGRYHSWIISQEGFPDELEITARDENNYVMALRHKSFDVQGVQFHPESVLTPDGERIMRNWLQ